MDVRTRRPGAGLWSFVFFAFSVLGLGCTVEDCTTPTYVTGEPPPETDGTSGDEAPGEPSDGDAPPSEGPGDDSAASDDDGAAVEDGSAGAGDVAGGSGGTGGTGDVAPGGDPGAGDRRACGSRGLEPCRGGEICRYPPEASCGEADAPGACIPRPEMCTEQYDPVCGCDGKTYGNECSALSAGISVRYAGECRPRAANPGIEGCVRAGCSGEICVDGELAGPVASPCVYKPEFACYATATCARTGDGTCGWLETAELRACLQAATSP